MYDFIVDFIGEVPENFTFIYSILTLTLGIAILGTSPIKSTIKSYIKITSFF